MYFKVLCGLNRMNSIFKQSFTHKPQQLIEYFVSNLVGLTWMNRLIWWGSSSTIEFGSAQLSRQRPHFTITIIHLYRRNLGDKDIYVCPLANLVPLYKEMGYSIALVIYIHTHILLQKKIKIKKAWWTAYFLFG